LFREEHSKALNNLAVGLIFLLHIPDTKEFQGGQFDEAEESFRTQIKILDEEVTRLKVIHFKAEPTLMLTSLSQATRG
jgi:hypothetical protein